MSPYNFWLEVSKIILILSASVELPLLQLYLLVELSPWKKQQQITKKKYTPSFFSHFKNIVLWIMYMKILVLVAGRCKCMHLYYFISAHIINIVCNFYFVESLSIFLNRQKFNTLPFLYFFSYILSDLFILIHGYKNQSILLKNKQMSQVKMLFITLQWVHRLQ